jgi:F-type H+-transporting ATPase subunit b
MEILRQLGELFLQAVPTVIIIFVFYLILRALFFKPLLKVMAEREARTIGAQKAAERARVNAAEREKQYQVALREARAKVYAEQEAARGKLLGERAAKLKDAHAKASTQVGEAKERVAKELVGAVREVEAGAAQLSGEIAKHLLNTPLRPPQSSQSEVR